MPDRNECSSDTVVVVLASTYFDGHQLYDQRIARALAERTSVVFVDPTRAIKPGAGLGTSRVHPQITVVPTWRLPLGNRSALYRLTGLLTGLQIRRHLKRNFPGSSYKYLVIAASLDCLRMLPRGTSVHLIKDDYSAGSELVGISAAKLERRLSSRMRTAEHVAVVSPHLRDKLHRRGVRPRIIPAGCEQPPAGLAEPEDLAAIPHPRALFIGMLSDRIDFEILRGLADTDVSLVLIGGTQNTFTKFDEADELLARDNVYRLDPRRGRDLDAAIRHCDVGLIPYTDSAFNRASFPLKTLEYLAAGIPVVSSPLPAIQWLDNSHIVEASSPSDFAQAVRDTVADPTITAESCSSSVADQTWRHRASEYAEIFDL